MKTFLKMAGSALLAGLMASAACGVAAADEAKDGYKGKPRTIMWASTDIDYTDTSDYKKDGPYVIGFSNASISNVWRVGLLHAVQKAAADNKDKISKLIITDANDDAAKQVSDVQDILQRGVDLLIVSPATAQELDPIVSQAMAQGVPVVLVDRRVTSDNFVSFITASDQVLGRIYAQWIAEKLGGKGNVIMLPGLAGASPAEIRIAAAKQVFAEYPDIKILDMQYTDWSPVKGKQVMAALLQKYGKDIDAVWSDSGLQASGALEAFAEAGWKDGEFPLFTCADLNGCIKQAVEHKAPVLNFDYPPAMGGVAVQVALDLLAGKPVPKIYAVNSDISISKGDETVSVKADRWAEDYARLDKSNDLILSTGLGPDYDPTTFKVDYPQ
jgi:ribose transport system substrate-binding protein